MRNARRALAAFVAAMLLTQPAAAQDISRGAAPADSVREALSAFGLTPEGVEINGHFSGGSTVIEAADTVNGPVVAVNGNADIHGYVAGGVYALWGDVIVHPGAEVLGGANAYHGRVIIDGGSVRGPMRTWRADPAVAAPAAAIPMTTGRALQMSAGWTGMLLAIALIVLVLAAGNLEATARALEQNFGRAFFIGVMGQLGFLPLVLLTVIAAAITIVGILLIPFLLVAAPVALAGFVTLGWLALALLTGRAVLRTRREPTTRPDSVRAIVAGVVLLMLPWLIASALYTTGTLGLMARVVAIAVTWVAATAGLGATLMSRAGSARARRVEKPEPAIQGWATPTPVAGVAAARRPIPARPGAEPR